MNLQELLERIGTVAEATSEDLASLEQDILAAYAALRADEDRSDETIEALAQLADALDGVRARSEVLETERAEREQRLAEIDARVTPAAEDEPETPVAEGGPEDEPETPDESETEPEAPVAEEPVEVEVEAEPVPIAAAASPGPTPLARIARSRPQAFAPRQSEPDTSPVRIIAAAEVPGVSAGSEIQNLDQLDKVISARLNGLMAGHGRTEAAVATIESPPRVTHVGGDRVGDNTDVLTAASQAFESLVASGELDILVAAGGVCGPVAPYYQQNILGTSDRPVASGLPGVGGERGGIRYVPAPVLSEMLVDTSGGAIGLQTQAEDVANTQKTCQAIVCGTETEVKVEAIWNCLSFGNAGARFHPERMEAYRSLSMTAWARRAEQYLLSLIDTGSTAVASNTPVVGAVPDLLHVAGQLTAGIRSRNRMAPDAPFQVVFPSWLIDMAAADIALRGAVPPNDAFGFARADLERGLALRGLSPIWSPDRQIFGTQGLGGVLDFPNTVTWNLFPAGTWVHIDGGTLDLGVVRDSTLNADNRFQLFMEGWESVAKVGVVSYKITSNLCASGMAAGVNDTDTICSGASFGS